MTCLICCGARTIELPVYHDTPPRISNNTTPIPLESSRQYACPECVTGGPISHFHAISRMSTVTLDAALRLGGRRDEIIAKEGAKLLAQALIHHGVVTMESTPDLDRNILETKFTLGIVSTSHVAFMEERLRDRGRRIADEVVRRSAQKIREMCRINTPADVAIDQVRAAAREVTDIPSGLVG